MKFADLLMQNAAERGLKYVFGLPGSGFPMDAMEAGRKAGVEFVHVSHESSAAIIAAYYGSGLGTAGLAIGVKGVGAGNMVGGIANVFFERMPVVCVFESGSTESNVDLVQVADHSAMFGSITKSYNVLERSTANDTLRDAIALATDGRNGPVVLDFPSNFDDGDCGELPVQPSRYVEASPNSDSLKRAQTLIDRSTRPLIVVGADVATTGATEDLMTFVEAIGGTVISNMDARGVFPESHPRCAGVMVGNYIPNTLEGELDDLCDLVVLVGADSLMTHVPWGFWRSVDHSLHGFFKESFIDELALAAGKDPYEYRGELLADNPRFRDVLDLAATKAGWGTPLPKNVGRGIAITQSFGTIVAQVVEAEIVDGSPRVRRVVCSVDAGFAMHPDGMAAQMESGIIYGLTAALYGDVSIHRGAVAQSNFHDYKMVRKW